MTKHETEDASQRCRTLRTQRMWMDDGKMVEKEKKK